MSSDPRIGQQIGHYRIESVIGRGGMGVVYLAEQIQLNRRVALKIVAEELGNDPGFRARFIREAQLAASLEHPNIIPIYDAGEEDETLYLAMRYVQGSDLSAALRQQGHLEPARTLELLAPVADALDDAHAALLIHRDIKPANILIASGQREQVLLTDFGLARRMDSSSRLTQTGLIVGTLTYLAPEQLRGEPVDGRTDQYALACVLFECLTGSPPFTGELEAHVMYAHLSREAPAPSSIRPELPRGLDAPVQRALSKEPNERFATCEELVNAVRAGLSSPKAAAPGPPAPPPPPPMPTRPEPAVPEPTEFAPAPTPAPPIKQEPTRATPPPTAAAASSGRRRPWIPLAIAAALVVGGGVAALVLLGGNGPPKTASSPSVASSSGPSGPSSTGHSGPTGSSGPSSPPPPAGGLGITWTPVALPNGSGLEVLRHVTSDKGTVVAVGSVPSHQAVVSSTSDGRQAFQQLSAGELTSVFTRGPKVTPRFVAVGTSPGPGGRDGVAWSSMDGQTWTLGKDGLAGPGDETAVDVSGGVTGVVAIGSASGAPAVWHSEDISSWDLEQGVPPGRDASMSAVLHVRPGTSKVVDGVYVVGRSGGRMAVWSTRDEKHWTLTVPAGSGFEGQANALTLVTRGPNPGLVVVGTHGGAAAVWHSTDGKHWAPSSIRGVSSRQSLNSVVALDQGVVAVGIDGPDAAVWTSRDGGIHWTEAAAIPREPSEARQEMLSVICFGGQLIAVGSSVSDAGQAGFAWTGSRPGGLTQQPVGGQPTFCP